MSDRPSTSAAALLASFRFGIISCLAASEAIFLSFYFFTVYPGHYPEFDTLQLFWLLFVLPPTFAGHYFSKHIIHP
jgi:hypothetical protein